MGNPNQWIADMYYVEKSCSTCLTPCHQVFDDQPWKVYAYAVIQQRDDLLLVKHRDSREWTLPGGVIPASSSIEDVLRGHVLEQSGMEIFMKFTPILRECTARHHFLLYREAVPASWSGTLASMEKSEIYEIQWYPQHRLPLQIAHHAKAYLTHERNAPLGETSEIRQVG